MFLFYAFICFRFGLKWFFFAIAALISSNHFFPQKEAYKRRTQADDLEPPEWRNNKATGTMVNTRKI